MTSVVPPSDDGPLPTGLERRNSYFEVLSSVSSDLNFVASDLRKAQIPFKASSPKSPLAVTASLPLSLTEDRYHHLLGARNLSLGTNNNASTAPTQYTQLPAAPLTPRKETPAMPSPFLKSFILPSSPSGFLSTHQVSLQQPSSDVPVSSPHPGHLSEDSMELSLLTRLVHTTPVWFLPNTQRTAAIHYLQGQPVGSFIVCRARDKDNLVLTMKHPGKGTGLYIEKLPILITENGVKLSNASEEFGNIEDLILHHLYHGDALPCKLALPAEIMAARNIRALQSLAVLEEEFWVRITQCRQGIPDKGQKETPSPTESPREWSKFPVTLPAGHHKPKHPLLTSLSEGKMAPKLTPPKGYVFMNKQPLPVHGTSAAEQPPPASKTVTTEPENPYMSMRSRNIESIALENRRLLKSWSFDEKSSPFLIDIPTTSQTLMRDPKRKSTDDTLLATFERQPMRCSTQSQQEFLMTNLSHYPPPQHSPPPPPKESLVDAYTAASAKGSSLQSHNQRASGEYYKPFERTKQGHHPPYAFGFDQVYKSPVPPLPPKRSMSSPQQGGCDKYHSRGSVLPVVQHSSQYAQPKPQGSGGNYSLTEVDLDALERTLAEKTEGHAELFTFGSIENEHYLGPVLQPSIHTPLVSPGKSKPANPLFEFDPLLLSEQQASTPQSQDVFSAPPESPAVLAQRDAPKSPPPSDVAVGVLLRLTLESSGDELAEELGQSDQSRQSMDGLTEEGSEDSSNEDSEQTYDEEDEEEMMRGKRGSSTADTQSSHSSEAHLGDVKTTASNDGKSQREQNINRLSGVTASQKKKIKKKKKNKKLSNFGRIQKYASVLTRGKTKKKKGDPTSEIQAAIHRLASNKSSYFSMMIECFVQNIKDKDSREKPGVLIRNIRQFMSGMKNYLFNRREPDVDEAMDKYYNLTMAELDAIVEGAIHRYILLPLKPEIYKCFITDHKESGALDELDHNIQLARAKTPEELGIKANYIPPKSETLEKFRHYFHLLEDAYSPIKKLEHLLDVVRTIYETVKDKNSSRGQSVQSMGADDFLPMFIYVLVQCEAVNIEIEADYMWGTLEPSMLSGEGGYYLTTLSSAICVLKQFEQENIFTETKGFLSIMVASGKGDNHIVHKALPVLPGMNAVDVCRILAHKMKIDNEHQYQLYLLSGDQEMPIGDSECPLQMKEEIEANQKRACFFGYKIESQPVKWFL